MLKRAPRICQCGRKVPAGIECECVGQRRRERERLKPRPSAAARGYGPAWRKARVEFLAQPENAYCSCGCGEKANTIDHIKAHKGDMTLFWDRSNWRAIFRDCNSRKAAKSEGAFGNPIR